jgi:hypothetical protein
MEEALYRDILRKLKTSEDIPYLEKKLGVESPVLFMILVQKTVEETRGGRFHKVKAGSPGLLERWRGGEGILEMARRTKFPPVLLASFIMEEMGFGKKTIKRMVKNPEQIRETRLRREVQEAVEMDFVYSPWAHRLQEERAAMGERIIKNWLVQRGARFKEENEMKKGKTPDFIIESDLLVEGVDIAWIDSKASFGSPQEHKKNMKDQLRFYQEEFGPGMVVYWFGYVEGIETDGTIVKDKDFFGGFHDEVTRLLGTTGREL